jgi:hypothetical protein
MTDNKAPITPAPNGRPDRDHVTADQTYEIEALMAKHHKTQKQVLDAIKKAGPLRVQIERALRK